MGAAAYQTTVKKHGTGVPVTSEAVTSLGSNQYQITDTTRRLIDPATAVVFNDTGGTVPVVSVDRFNGIITTDGSEDAGPWDADFTYFPTVNLAGSNSFDFELGGDVLDETPLGGSGARERTYGLHDVTITIDRYDPLTRELITAKLGENPVLIEIAPGGVTDEDEKLKGWFVIDTGNQSGDVGSLENQNLTLMLANFPGLGVFFTYGGIVVSQ